jgi:transposase
MRFTDLLDRQERGEITQDEAAVYLGMSVRTFQRWRDRYSAEGEDGLLDRRVGRPSPRRAPREELERMLGLFRDKYADFTPKHFHEQLVKRHGYKLGYTVTRLALHAAGLARPARQRSAHRKKRARRPLRGMLVHQDGSRHAWLEGQPALDLIATIDDATSEVLSMFLVEEEGTASTFRALAEVISAHGLFLALYTDRGSHYFYTPKAGEAVSKAQLTQVGRALATLGIEHIAAYSPEARGRSERAFRTLQGRLPKEFRLAGIATIEAANAWLAEHYIAEHNGLFAVAAEDEGSAFVADSKGLAPDILCVIEERTVAKDNTVGWNGLRLQLPESRLRPHFVKAKVQVRQYPDGTLAVDLGPHRLARYTSEGSLIIPAGSSVAAGSPPSRRGLDRASGMDGAPPRPALTAPRPAARMEERAGTEKRASSRTKKPAKRLAGAAAAVP